MDTLHLSRKVATNDKLHFGFLVEIPPRFKVAIGRPKDQPLYLRLRSSIVLSEKQRAVFNEMPEETKMSVYRAIRVESGRSKIHHHMHKNLELLYLQKEVLITDLKDEARFKDIIDEVHCAADVIMDTIDSLVKPPSRASGNEALLSKSDSLITIV